MSNEEAFGGECVWLYVDVRASDFVDKGGLSDVRVAADKECTRIGVNGGETRDVLPDLFEVGKRIFLSAHDRSHSIDIALVCT